MNIYTYLAFVVSCVLLASIPGPSVALIVANGLTHGTRYGLVSVLGTGTAMIPHLTITVLGAGVILTFMASAFEWIRWIGVGYLFYLGIKSWREATGSLKVSADQDTVPYRMLFWRGFWVSLFNPKTVLFLGAFFPQFVTPGPDVFAQMLLLAITYMMVINFIDCLWALLAGRAGPLLHRFGRMRNRLSGGFLMLGGVGLALAKRP